MPATPRNANTGRRYTPADIGAALLIAVEDYDRLTADEAENDETPAFSDLPHDADELREARLDLTDRFASLARTAGALLKVLDADRTALDNIAVMLGTADRWSDEHASSIARIVARTERPDPGQPTDTYRRDFAFAVRRFAPGEYAHDDENEEHVHYAAELDTSPPGACAPVHAVTAHSATRDGIHDVIDSARDDGASLLAVYAERVTGTADACTCTADDTRRAFEFLGW